MKYKMELIMGYMTENGREDEDQLGQGEGIRQEKGQREDKEEGERDFIEEDKRGKEDRQKNIGGEG